MKTEYTSKIISVLKMNPFERIRYGHPFLKYLLKYKKDGSVQKYFLKDYKFFLGALREKDKSNADLINSLKKEGIDLKNTMSQIKDESAKREENIGEKDSIIFNLEKTLKRRKENYRTGIEEKNEMIKTLELQLDNSEKVVEKEVVYVPKDPDPKIRKYIQSCIKEVRAIPKKKGKTTVSGMGISTSQHSHPKDFHKLIEKLSSSIFVYKIDWYTVSPKCGTKMKTIKTKRHGEKRLYYIDMVYSDSNSFGAEIRVWLTTKTSIQNEFVKSCIENDTLKWFGK